MNKDLFWTFSGARLRKVGSVAGKQWNWIFLPGGPGLGSESLSLLIDSLHLPGTAWLLDLPGDGSNTTENNKEAFSHWSLALVEAVLEFKKVILVAHSTGGMYALSTPELEKHLDALVLLDSAPDARWQVFFGEVQRRLPIPEIKELFEEYTKHPSNVALKALTLASAPYLFTKKSLSKGIEMLESLPFSYEAYSWSEEHFDRTYRAKWVPKSLPTLILAGERDLVTPLKLFRDEKQFARDTIFFHSVKDGGHFPWIENPVDVAEAFETFYQKLR